MTERDDGVPQAVARKPGARSLQFVWIVPIVAALVGGFIALKNVWEHGPTITIRFLSGEGIEANKTRIKHKAVDIGTVKSVGLSSDHKTVIVTAEHIVPVGVIAPDHVITPAPLVDYLITNG